MHFPFEPPGTALILGVTGAIGRETAAALARRGWRIRALTRRPLEDLPHVPFDIDWRQGDALDADSVVAAAEGADIIFHGVNPPGYRRWREDGLPMLANSIAVAEATGATLLFPANLYVYSPDAPDRVNPDAERAPRTRKGRVRLEMELMLEGAARSGRIRAIVLRAGDFFGPGIAKSWFGGAISRGGVSARAIRTLTPDGVSHAWAYVPDLGEAFARLAERRASLPAFTMAHFAGHTDPSGCALAESARRALGRPDLPVKPFRWTAFWMAAPFAPFIREAFEMRWLWSKSLTLDNAGLEALIGPEPHTPLDEAVRAALGLAAQTAPAVERARAASALLASGS